MSKEITIFYGTETGNSQELAEKAESILGKEGYKINVSNLEDTNPDDLLKIKLSLFIVSTWGEGDPPLDAEDFYETYLEKINAVTAEDVKRVANKYFKIANTRIIVVGKGSDVVENLEKVGFPINYFDKYANAVAKPVFNKAIPEGMTALDVVDNYIKAIGGKDMLLNVNTLVSNMDVTLPGAPFKPMAISKKMMPNKISFEMKANMGGQTMSLMKRNFSGEKGYMEQQGQKMQMSEEEIIEAKNVEGIFDELYYNEAVSYTHLTLPTKA